MAEKILNFIEALKKKPQVSKFDETETKQGMILPILQLLGWNVWDTEEVKPEYPVEGKKAVDGGRVDFCLRIKGKSEIFLEAKRPGEDLEKHQEQLLTYSFKEGVDLAVLSNGIFWWFYLPRKKGHWKERKFYAIDIMQQGSGEITEKFLELLSRDNVQSGKAVQNAKSIYEQLDRQKKINETMPKAWNKIITGGDERLCDLLAETTESLCGFRPDNEDVKNMLGIHKNNLMLSEMVLGRVPVKPAIPETRDKSSVTKYTIQNRQVYKEFNQQLLGKINKQTTLRFIDKNLEKEWLSTIPDNYGCNYYYAILKKGAIIGFENWDKDHDKIIFDKLSPQKNDIEKEIGYSLEWLRNDEKQNWRILVRFSEGGRDNQETWAVLQDMMVDAMDKFARVFSPRLEAIIHMPEQ